MKVQSQSELHYKFQITWATQQDPVLTKNRSHPKYDKQLIFFWNVRYNFLKNYAHRYKEAIQEEFSKMVTLSGRTEWDYGAGWEGRGTHSLGYP
jgi:hypothetical protein